MANVRSIRCLLIGLILFVATGIVGTILSEYNLIGHPGLWFVGMWRSADSAARNESRIRWSNVTYNKTTLTSLTNVRLEYAVNKSDFKLKKDRIIILNYNEWLPNVDRSDSHTNDGACPYSNCYFTHNQSLFNKSSAVVFCMRGHFSFKPPDKKPGQVWIFNTMESHLNAWGFNWRNVNWRDKMNWTANYRLDSDIVAPYGLLQTAAQPIIRNYQNLLENKTSLVAWIVSHCGSPSGRDKYVAELQQYIPVDIYGACGKPLVNDRRKTIEQYMFYLAFENSFCLDYITEKFFLYYQYDTVLVARGGADYDKILPHDTFINTASYSSVKELGEFLLYLSKNETAYLSYLKNRDKYEPAPYNFGCYICEKLNSPDKYRNVYSNMVDMWDKGTCWLPEDYTQSGSEKEVFFIVFMFIATLLGVSFHNQCCGRILTK